MHRKRICCNNTEKIIYQHFNEQYSKYNTSSRFLEKNLVLPQTIFFTLKFQQSSMRLLPVRYPIAI
jgi:hypothetical protein